ncbi:MAG TPA: TIGR04255 family protein [Chthoniobacterales bacterium]|jgi:uncharacterized protein (TIGR04255 family)|nr:TIGR04255 family protein [Chthoniobacterales bacterium]
MADRFPIPIPKRLPIKIDPCPIVEAILEIRFVTSESWATLPGLLFTRIRKRYPEQKVLPLGQLPEEIRRREPAFTYQPLIQFLGADFLIQFGPRVIGLVAKSKNYPGWAALQKEMTWLVSELRQLGFVSEGERLGVRYINFFTFNVFEQLVLEVSAAGKQFSDTELSITSALSKPTLTSRLLVANSAIVGVGESARHGSVLDVDVWLGPADFDLFQNGMPKFDAAHEFEKQIFFGLLKADFLATLNPVYK